MRALVRRRDYLVELREREPYRGSDYDRQEASALDWALALVTHLRKDGEMDVEFQEVERDREERLAEEAGEAQSRGVETPCPVCGEEMEPRSFFDEEAVGGWACAGCDFSVLGDYEPENLITDWRGNSVVELRRQRVAS